ncbi:hypothetical protein NCAS_0E03670 [Naumovozyma castellii]|uniref:Uncharacterized protein n=1 Tax=Naumovozyma castellii TaxID=27288 RepID=G0VG18_NAUCA|nr:hypothetical protein NCAS_0E03670 [Naumovozyma castellii CBS 4309]CCC70437.1 hypothetical protein NCAS_0E03670 [Naumovozyma castellii CBS 4309]
MDTFSGEILPGRDIPSVRELVQQRQMKRKRPESNKLVQKMEDSLIKWRVPGSQNKGSAMAIEGNHPYQFATPVKKSVKSESDVWNSVRHWWKDQKQEVPEESEKIDITRFNETVIGVDAEEEEISFMTDESRSGRSNSAKTPIAYPINMNNNTGNRYLVGSTIQKPKKCSFDPGDTLTSLQSMYSQYYNYPVPVSYLNITNGMNQLPAQFSYEQQQPIETNNAENQEDNRHGQGKRQWFLCCNLF